MTAMADPINGTVLVEIDDKYMNARLTITPPRNGGKAVTEEQVRQEIALKGVRYNIDENAIKEAFGNGGVSVQLAKGTPPIDGRNGYLVYHFERKNGAQMKADEFGNVDYRDLGMIQNIEKDVVIADIFPETPGSRGRDSGFPVLYCMRVITLFSQSMSPKDRFATSDTRKPSLEHSVTIA